MLIRFMQKLVRYFRRKSIESTGIMKPYILSSYPLLSGDGLLLSSDLILDDIVDIDFDHNLVRKRIKAGDNSSVKIFCTLDLFNLISDFSRVVHLLSRINALNSNTVLILHNGDLAPDSERLFLASQYVKRIFAQNLLISSANIFPLPIGFENLRYGNLDFFRHACQSFRNIKLGLYTEKKIYVSCRIDVSTNSEKRRDCLSKFLQSSYKYECGFVTPSVYFNELLSSKFVLSPPGNGNDCHRTWEALICGAIPVLLKNSFNEDFANLMPAVIVSDWNDFLLLPSEELDALYDSLILKFNPELLTLFYWLEKMEIV